MAWGDMSARSNLLTYHSLPSGPTRGPVNQHSPRKGLSHPSSTPSPQFGTDMLDIEPQKTTHILEFERRSRVALHEPGLRVTKERAPLSRIREDVPLKATKSICYH